MKKHENKLKFQLTDLQWRIIVVIEAIVLGSLNFIRLFDNNFWGDEGFSIRLMKMGFGGLIKATAEDVHPPLYYMFAKIIYGLFGSYGWVFHLSAFLPYAIILIISCTLIYSTYGKETAFLFNIFVSILNHSLTYIMEVRMYELGALFIILAAYMYLYIIDNKDTVWGFVLFTVVSLGAAYSHYYCVISVSVFYLALMFLAVTKKLSPLKVGLVCVATIIGYLPWFMTMLNTAKTVTNDFWIGRAPGISQSIFYFFSSGSRFYSVFMFALTIFTALLLFTESKENLRIIPLILSAPATMAFGIIISSVYRPVYLVRYIYPSTMVFCLAFCIMMEKFKRKLLWTGLLTILTLVICVPGYINVVKSEKEKDAKCAESCGVVIENINSNDLVLTNNTFIGWTVFEYYFPELSCFNADFNYRDFDSNKNYYLMWNEFLSESENNWLAECGFTPELLMDNGCIGDADFKLYKLNRVN